jgi:hypothetical protein
MACVFGGVLLTWSFLANRADLQQFGLPAAVVGQALLVVGFALQLEGVWRQHRATAELLAELDEQLSELRGAAHSDPQRGPTLDGHGTEGPDPHLQLAKLRSHLHAWAPK